MKFLGIVIGIVIAAFMAKFVLAAAFTVLHLLFWVALVAALGAGSVALYKLGTSGSKKEVGSSRRNRYLP